MLKLVVNNTSPAYGILLSQEFEAKQTPALFPPIETFLVDFQEISHNLYVYRAQDLAHSLTCEMTLELTHGFSVSAKDSEAENYIVPIMTGNFPSIDVSRFNERICFDEYLQGILMFQFQLKILEHLFQFCKEKGAINLTMLFNDTNLDYLEAYRRFFTSEEEVITARGVRTKIMIQMDRRTHKDLNEYIEAVDTDLRHTLWRDQKDNLSFRKYLMDHSLSVN